jgi:hypothetical protein
MLGQATRPEAALKKPGLGQVLRDTWYVFCREMLLPLRDPFSLIFSLVQPLVFLALFGPLLGSAVGAPAFGGQSTLQWFLPGVVVMIALFGMSMTGSNLQYELMTGSYERILATPLSRSSLMIGWASGRSAGTPASDPAGPRLPGASGPCGSCRRRSSGSSRARRRSAGSCSAPACPGRTRPGLPRPGVRRRA